MTTTTKTDDYIGRDLTTPDTDAHDYLGRGIMAGDRDYMGRLLIGGGGGDASALLDEAAVRFDFSEYTDINDMVDVNGSWGPLAVSGDFTPESTEFDVSGLHIVGGEGAAAQFLINGIASPLTIGPDGLTFVDVIVNHLAFDGSVNPSWFLSWCDNADSGAPYIENKWHWSSVQSEWNVDLQDVYPSHRPDCRLQQIVGVHRARP